jgi:hypothetical protein
VRTLGYFFLGLVGYGCIAVGIAKLLARRLHR